ncbi:MAG: glycosyl transferase, partial [Melioribacteraceae bacterium]|nr:glycosyl transferase [Melioribacteraceae bacterium]
FDDENKEYVINRPDTPLPWINYLGTKDFFGIISNTAGGYSFYQDAKLRRLTRYRYNNIPMDSNGRYIYVKDGDTIWNPSWKPMMVDLDKYVCRHGLGYTKIIGIKNDLEISVLYFIPPNGLNEVWNIEVKNNSENHKNIRLWGFVEWCLWDAWDDMTNFQRNYSIGEVEVEYKAIFHITEYRERRNHYAYFATNAETSGFDTSRDEFIGVHNGLNNPKAVLNGACTNSVAHGWLPLGVHQIDLDLDPGESHSFNIILGYAENPNDNKYHSDGKIVKSEFLKAKEKYLDNDSTDVEFTNHKKYWSDILSKFSTDTPDDIVNRMANIWNQYQCMVTFNMSRSASLYESGIGRGMGYRDSNQDALGFVHMKPEWARERILDIAATQLSDGTCYHQYQPLTKKGNADVGGGFNDDPLWLLLSTSAYIKETGDTSILNEQIGFADIDSSDTTLMDHLKISIEYTLNNLGPNELPLIGHADWNDCLNLNCFSAEPGESFQLAGHIENDRVAESVMIAGLFCRASDEMAGIYKYLGNNAESQRYLTYAQNMRNTIIDKGWDGEWFLRAYDSFGRKLGSKENEEGQIFIESQGWCILGGVGIENGFAEKSLNSVRERLATKNGIILQQPPFATYHLHLGEISSYPPGYKENAGIFT